MHQDRFSSVACPNGKAESHAAAPSPNGSIGERNSPAPPPSPGRDAGGRFAPGNAGGPGNPHARQVAALKKAFLEEMGQGIGLETYAQRAFFPFGGGMEPLDRAWDDKPWTRGR